ncbi:DUF1566 domain-containing protein [Sorangium sp. So ce429]
MCPGPGEPFFGQDGNYLIDVPSYADGDGVVTDSVTGLVWEKVIEDVSFEHVGALEHCAALAEAEVGGRTDWRLPTRREIVSLLDFGHATGLFWVSQGDRDPYTGAVMRARRGIFSDEEPVVLAAAQTAPYGLALDDEFVYWTNREGGAVVRARKDSNGNGPFDTIWADAGSPHAVIVDATHVYWTVLALDDGDGRVMAAPKDSTGEGPFTTIATAQGDVREIALDGTYVYWTTSRTGTVMRAPKVGGQGEVTALVTGARNPRGIVADRTGVYWTEFESTNIMKMWPNGIIGAFVAREASPYGITLDAERVYWTNGLGSNGTVESATI